MDKAVKKFLITGGAGFIGSALIRHIINDTSYKVVNIDKLTYAGNLESLESIEGNERYVFERADICNNIKIRRIFNQHQPDVVMHLAAESHVDRSIEGPDEFIKTNIMGTYQLLEQSRLYFSDLDDRKKGEFRFHHISTDEVYGDLGDTEFLFTEKTSYNPSSPYSASKASSDHLVRAWQRTFNLPTLITNCSNNYGPYQFPEKLIPLMILNALDFKELPVYGDGNQIRDWLYVSDHTSAIRCVLQKGEIGEVYNVGGWNEKTNIDIVNKICSLLDELRPDIKGPYSRLIEFVRDRPGHDKRYALNSNKIKNNFGWKAKTSIDEGLLKTVLWYTKNDLYFKELKKIDIVKRLGLN